MGFAAKPRQVRVQISMAGARFRVVLSVGFCFEGERGQGRIVDRVEVNDEPYVCHFVGLWSSPNTSVAFHLISRISRRQRFTPVGLSSNQSQLSDKVGINSLDC